MRNNKNIHFTHLKTNAFTLVELAIVIVIIGLLVGGVLTGQELIEQAKIRKTIAEMDSFEASILTFKAKYNALPGDMRNATQIWGQVSANCTTQFGNGTQTCNGNGDGLISYFVGGSPAPHEDLRLWQHLSNAKLVKGSYRGTSTGLDHTYRFIPDITVPKNQYIGGWQIWSGIQVHNTWTGLNGGNFYVFVNASTATSNQWWAPSLTPEQLMSIDLKLDDGKPWQGRVRNMGDAYTSSCATANDSNINAGYNLATSRLRCVPIFHSKVN